MDRLKRKYCPRCTIAFECKVDDIAQCQCSNINLTIEAQLYISNQYQDCLCAACLTAIQAVSDNIFKPG